MNNWNSEDQARVNDYRWVSFLLMSSNRSTKRQVRGERKVGWRMEEGAVRFWGSVCSFAVCEYECVGVKGSVSGRLTHARRQLAASFGNDLDWAGLLGLSCFLAFLAYRNRDAQDHDYPSIGECEKSRK